MKLVCIPSAGSSATMYFGLKALLPSSVEVVPLELAGRGMRMKDAHITSFNEQLADLQQTYAHVFTGDYVLFGHSMGGLLALGLAQKIQGNNAYSVPKAIIASASSLPVHNGESSEQLKEQQTAQHTAQTALDDDSLIALLKKQNGTPDIVFEHKELLNMLLENLRADIQVCQSFKVTDTKLALPIHVFAGTQDSITNEHIQQWQNYTAQPLTTDWFEGGHFYLQADQSEKQFIQTLIQRIKQYT